MKIGQFNLDAQDGFARAGVLQTAHGAILTPVFMPVGTKASVKSLDPNVLNQLGTQIILGNTYHLYLAPGDQLIRDLGGLHQFMAWNKPILTDSGGFQVFSLGMGKKGRDVNSDDVIPDAIITEEGVEFRSHKDGTKHFISPERSMEIQANLGADIIMAFDECPPHPSSKDYFETSMHRTHRWLERCIVRKMQLETAVISTESALWRSSGEIYNNFSKISPTPTESSGGRDDILIKQNIPRDQLLFGIVQGGAVKRLREESAQFVANQNLPGIAIGGVAVGESKQAQIEQVEWVVPHLPVDKPRYLMGVGTPLDLLNFVARGIDMFDCVLPTRLARNGAVWVVEKGRGSREQIKNAKYRTDARPLSENCLCSTCTRFSRAYLHHLFMEKEPLALQLASVHNIYVLQTLMSGAREAIIEGRFEVFFHAQTAIWSVE